MLSAAVKAASLPFGGVPGRTYAATAGDMVNLIFSAIRRLVL
jgi:hypothetical protein